MKSGLQPELESKRIETAQTRKLVWVLLGTSFLTSVLMVMLRRTQPNSSLRWVFLAILVPQIYWLYRLAKQTGKLKSVLPPEMESQRITIGNTATCLWERCS